MSNLYREPSIDASYQVSKMETVRLVAGRWVSVGTPVSSTYKANSHDITEILVKVGLNTIAINLAHCSQIKQCFIFQMYYCELRQV
jgi:hypothetical protein